MLNLSIQALQAYISIFGSTSSQVQLSYFLMVMISGLPYTNFL